MESKARPQKIGTETIRMQGISALVSLGAFAGGKKKSLKEYYLLDSDGYQLLDSEDYYLTVKG